MPWYLNPRLWGQEKLNSSPTPASQVLKTQKAATPTLFLSVISAFSCFYTHVKISTLSFKNYVFMPLHSFIKVYLPVCLHYTVIFVHFLSFSLPFYFLSYIPVFILFIYFFRFWTYFIFLLQFLFFLSFLHVSIVIFEPLHYYDFFHFLKFLLMSWSFLFPSIILLSTLYSSSSFFIYLTWFLLYLSTYSASFFYLIHLLFLYLS